MRALSFAACVAAGAACTADAGNAETDVAADEDTRRPPGRDASREEDVELEGAGTDAAGDISADEDVEAGDQGDSEAGTEDAPSDAVADEGRDARDGSPSDAAPGECAPGVRASTGVHVLDYNSDPLRVGDRLLVTVEILSAGPGEVMGALLIDTDNMEALTGTVQRDGAEFPPAVIETNRLRIPLDALEPHLFTFEASVVSDRALVSVMARVEGPDACVVSRSGSGALLQVIGGESKTSLCVDMGELRSLQVAPEIRLQNTNHYRESNGIRADLMAGDFIFCPQRPTIVHAAEFCVRSAPSQSVTLAGHYRADAWWEVDDFMLFEVFDGATLVRDGFTSQHHNGGSTFWCGETSALMCTSGCTASLTRTDEARAIVPIAVAEAEGAGARQHIDREVEIGALLDGVPNASLRCTALDSGVEGRLRPGIFLISADPD